MFRGFKIMVLLCLILSIDGYVIAKPNAKLEQYLQNETHDLLGFSVANVQKPTFMGIPIGEKWYTQNTQKDEPQYNFHTTEVIQTKHDQYKGRRYQYVRLFNPDLLGKLAVVAREVTM